MGGLSKAEVVRVTNLWIGVHGGYLGDFSYASHADFYPVYCGIDEIDPDAMSGTTRARFEQILSEAPPPRQAKILRGVLERFPPGTTPPTGSRADRGPQSERWIRDLISRVEGDGATVEVEPPGFDVPADPEEEGVSPSSAVVARTTSRAIRLTSIATVEKLAQEIIDGSDSAAETAIAEVALVAVGNLRAFIDGYPDASKVQAWLHLVDVIAKTLLPAYGKLGELGRALHDVWKAHH